MEQEKKEINKLIGAHIGYRSEYTIGGELLTQVIDTSFICDTCKMYEVRDLKILCRPHSDLYEINPETGKEFIRDLAYCCFWPGRAETKILKEILWAELFYPQLDMGLCVYRNWHIRISGGSLKGWDQVKAFKWLHKNGFGPFVSDEFKKEILPTQQQPKLENG